MTQDAGALLKLAGRLRAAAISFEGQRAWHANAVDGDCEPHDSWQTEMDDASKAAIEAAEILTCQAASQGSVGGEAVRVPKVRTSHHRNAEEAARLQAIVAEKYALSPVKTGGGERSAVQSGDAATGPVPYVAWIAFAENGNVRFWTGDYNRAIEERRRGLDLRAFTLAELVALVARPAAQAPTISVKPMQLSDDRTDYFVSISVGDREITPYVFRDEQFKAEYEAASFRWLLLGEPKPDLMAYSEAGWPSTMPSASSPAQAVTDPDAVEFAAALIVAPLVGADFDKDGCSCQKCEGDREEAREIVRRIAHAFATASTVPSASRGTEA